MHHRFNMRKLYRVFCVVVFLAGIALTVSAAKKITIHTMPENATIMIDGAEVGNGTYTVKFERKVDFYMVKVSAPGYLTKSFKLLKSNPNNSVLYRLSPDEAMQSSRGGEDAGMDMANRWFDIICGKGVTEDEVWKRLIQVSLNYFDNIEIRDKEAGWIRTGWKTTTFAEQVVRTQMEVRVSFNSSYTASYRVKISSEIKDKNCPGTQCYTKYDRVLNSFTPLIEELQTSVAKGNIQQTK